MIHVPHYIGTFPPSPPPTWDLTVQGPQPWSQLNTPLSDMGPHCTVIPQTCSNFFNIGSISLYKNNPNSPYPPPPSQDMFKLSHCEVHTVGKRAIRILLECFLVINVSTYYSFRKAPYQNITGSRKSVKKLFCINLSHELSYALSKNLE